MKVYVLQDMSEDHSSFLTPREDFNLKKSNFSSTFNNFKKKPLQFIQMNALTVSDTGLGPREIRGEF